MYLNASIIISDLQESYIGIAFIPEIKEGVHV